jgi:hypothetical protein
MKYLRTVDLCWHIQTLLTKAIIARVAAQNETARELEYIQLQNQLHDKKMTIMAAKRGITFSELDEEPQVPHDAGPSSPNLSCFFLVFIAYTVTVFCIFLIAYTVTVF